jgi:multidrug efflux pump subunit AcrA (membrane-fusion protein)
VDERTYLNLTGQTASTGALAAVKLPVLMRLANEQDYPEPGTVDFLDNRLNGNTGTIRMRAVFPNHQGILKSGLFGRVRLPIGSAYQALMVPAQALVSDQDRKYVYVVDSENKVEYRSVKIGQAIAGLRVIQEPRRGKDGKVLRDQDGRIVEGLLPGERVIISGIQRVRPQLEVKAEMRKPPEPPESPLRKLLTQSQAKVQDQPGTAEPVPSPPARRAAGPGATGHGRGHGKR